MEALVGAAAGLASGAFGSAISYYEENGTLDGSTDESLEGASTGFMSGAFSGAASGGMDGAIEELVVLDTNQIYIYHCICMSNYDSLFKNATNLQQRGRTMKVQEVKAKMQQEKLLDDREIWVYATKKSASIGALGGAVGGAIGAAMGAVILSVYDNTFYIHKAAMDNSYKECLGTFNISEMEIVKAKAGLFGGKFVFKCNGNAYKFDLPSRANKFVEFFR